MAANPPKHSQKTLTPVVFHTLMALSEGPRHGYAISQQVEAASEGGVRMGPGTLYGSLQRLEKAGWVEECDAAADDAGPHGGRRRYYRLTDAGDGALRTEAQRLESLVGLEQFRALVERR